MSMMYCHAHDRHFDSDYDVDCPECEEEEIARDEIAHDHANDQMVNHAYST